MTVYVDESFETGVVGSGWASSDPPNHSTSVVVESSWSIDGTKSLRRFQPAAINYMHSNIITVPNSNNLYWRLYAYINARPTSENFMFMGYPPYSLEGPYLRPNGSIGWDYGMQNSTLLFGGASVIQNGDIIRLEMRAAPTGGSNGGLKLFKNGNVHGTTPDYEVTNITTFAWYSYTNSSVYVGWSPATYSGDIFVDAFKIQDTDWVGPVSGQAPASKKGWGLKV